MSKNILLETTRQQLIDMSKKGQNYVDQRINRWNKKSKIIVANTVADYNQIDMNEFWKNDTLKFIVKVKGETNNYNVTVEFTGLHRKIQKYVKQDKNRFNRDNVTKALMDAISSSDVKVECNCLHPDTKIKLLDGTEPTIRELCERFEQGETLWCYSVDKDGLYKPGKIEKVWKTKTTKEFIRVTLDNNEEILCTPEHLFMLRNGEYISAEDLQINDSLMPLYFREGNNGYDLVKNNLTNRYESIYKLTASNIYKDEIEQATLRALDDDSLKMSYNVAIHHKDFNKKNNNPENLQIMTAWEHWNYHASLCGENRPVTEKLRDIARKNAIIRNANPTEAMLQQRKAFNEAGRKHNYELSEEEYIWRQNNMKNIGLKTQEKRRNMSEDERKKYYEEKYGKNWKDNIGKSNKTVWYRYTEEEYKNRCYINHLSNQKAKQKISKSITAFYKNNPEKAKARFRSKIKSVLLEMINEKIELTFENYVQKASKKGTPKNLNKLLSYYENITSWNDLIKYYELNHKVIKVERVYLDNTDVYDIKVEKWHNFLLGAGIIVHNCPDFKFRLSYNATQKGFKAGTPENRPANITNPLNDKGACCKHILAVINNAMWIRNVASVIVNYSNYAKEHMEYNYSRYIFPNIYGMSYSQAVQMCIDDFDSDGDVIDTLKTDESIVNLANEIAKSRFRGNKTKQQIKQENERKAELEKGKEDQIKQQNNLNNQNN